MRSEVAKKFEELKFLEIMETVLNKILQSNFQNLHCPECLMKILNVLFVFININPLSTQTFFNSNLSPIEFSFWSNLIFLFLEEDIGVQLQVFYLLFLLANLSNSSQVKEIFKFLLDDLLQQGPSASFASYYNRVYLPMSCNLQLWKEKSNWNKNLFFQEFLDLLSYGFTNTCPNLCAFVKANNILENINEILKIGYKPLYFSAIKLYKTILLQEDSLILKYILMNGLIDWILDLFVKYQNSRNMIFSASSEFVDMIYKGKIELVAEYIVLFWCYTLFTQY